MYIFTGVMVFKGGGGKHIINFTLNFPGTKVFRRDEALLATPLLTILLHMYINKTLRIRIIVVHNT